jgi:hypothetical protein
MVKFGLLKSNINATVTPTEITKEKVIHFIVITHVFALKW